MAARCSSSSMRPPAGASAALDGVVVVELSGQSAAMRVGPCFDADQVIAALDPVAAERGVPPRAASEGRRERLDVLRGAVDRCGHGGLTSRALRQRRDGVQRTAIGLETPPSSGGSAVGATF